MRRAFLLLLLLAAPALAHGDTHGQAIPPLWATALDAEPGNVTAFDMESALAAGSLALVHSEHLGTVPAGGIDTAVRLSLVLDTDPPRTVRDWTVRPGEAPTFGLLVPEDGTYSVTAETSGQDTQRVGVYYDTEADVTWKRMPPDLRDGIVFFPWAAPANGRFQAVVPEPQANELSVQVVRAKTTDAEWPTGFETVAESGTPRFSKAYNIDTHTLTWDAVEGERYYVMLKTTESFWPPPSDRQPYDPEADRYVYGPWDVHVVIGPEESRDSPWPMLPVLAAVAFLRRQRAE